MDVCLLWVLCVVRWKCMRRADHPFKWIIPSVECVIVFSNLISEEDYAHWVLSSQTKTWSTFNGGINFDKILVICVAQSDVWPALKFKIILFHLGTSLVLNPLQLEDCFVFFVRSCLVFNLWR